MKTENRRLEALFGSQQPVPVILGGHVNGLGLARSLARIGRRSIVIDAERTMAFRSRYVSGLLCPHPQHDEEGFIAFLEKLGARLSAPGFLLCTNDIWLIPVSRNQHRLQERFHFPMSPWSVIERAIAKTRLYAHAEKEGIPCPTTLQCSSLAALREARQRIPYPCVIKPSVTVGFLEALGVQGRTIVVKDSAEFDAVIARIDACGLAHTDLIVQEQIPGGVENLFTITTYSNREGEIIGYSTGHKIRQYPPDAGTIVAGRVTHEPRLYELGRQLIRSLGFHGIANTEFKKDARDGSFKLIEINPRPGMWNYSVLAAGLNLPAMAYREACGERLGFVGGTQREVVWLRTLDDLRNCLYVYRATGYPQHALSVGEWLRTIRGDRVDAVFQVRDPLPFLFELAGLVRGAARVAARGLRLR